MYSMLLYLGDLRQVFLQSSSNNSRKLMAIGKNRGSKIFTAIYTITLLIADLPPIDTSDTQMRSGQI